MQSERGAAIGPGRAVDRCVEVRRNVQMVAAEAHGRDVRLEVDGADSSQGLRPSLRRRARTPWPRTRANRWWRNPARASRNRSGEDRARRRPTRSIPDRRSRRRRGWSLPQTATCKTRLLRERDGNRRTRRHRRFGGTVMARSAAAYIRDVWIGRRFPKNHCQRLCRQLPGRQAFTTGSRDAFVLAHAETRPPSHTATAPFRDAPSSPMMSDIVNSMESPAR